MSMHLSQAAISRMNMQPSLIMQAYAPMAAESLRLLATVDPEREARDQSKARSDMLSAYGYTGHADEKPFAYVDGIAFIPITGLLINRFSGCYGWVTGYNYIRAMMNAAVEDADVQLIVFDCNSGGGEVSGCFELAADIRATRDKKPSVAVVDAMCYSACYALASAATRIVVTPSGGVGSIGVVATHVDMSKMLNDWGVKFTFIISGDHKVDGNQYEALPEPVRKSIQARVDSTRQEFVALVAANRGLDAKVVFDTQAQCYSASEALALGLVNAIAPPLEAVQAFRNELSGSQTNQENTMSGNTAKPGAESTTAPEKANTETAVVEADKPMVTTDASAERTAERDRIKGITGHEAAKGKSVLANHLALNTDLSVEAAAAILSASAVEVKGEAGPSAFNAAMENSDHPNIGADAGAGGEMTAAQRILKSQSLATGTATH